MLLLSIGIFLVIGINSITDGLVEFGIYNIFLAIMVLAIYLFLRKRV